MPSNSYAAVDLPTISIVTPCRNAVHFINEAIESVRSQHYPCLEHIVLDACSTDGTLAVLARHSDITFISERDAGVYDALNKGVARAHGEVIGFLNADDIYPDDTFVRIGAAFAAKPDIDVISGHSIVFEDDGAGHRQVRLARTHASEHGLWLPELTFGVPGFNGFFFRRRVFERVGQFNCRYLITADREFLIRLALMDLRALQIDQATIWYRAHRGSLSINPQMSNLLKISREYAEMAAEFGRTTKGRSRNIFLAWHAFEGSKVVMRELLAGRMRVAVGELGRSAVQNPLWPFRLAHAFSLRRAVRRLDADAQREVTREASPSEDGS